MNFFFQISLKLNKTFENNFVEIHQKDQSKMNNQWKYREVEYVSPPGLFHERYLTSLILKKIKRRNYHCDESNSVQVTKCLDDFYMRKLNCSFPWLQMTQHLNLQKCWNNHYIEDLKKLMRNVSKIREKHSEEVQQCLSPNCVRTKWKTLKYEKFNYSDPGMVNFVIDSSLVNYFQFKKQTNICILDSQSSNKKNFRLK